MRSGDFAIIAASCWPFPLSLASERLPLYARRAEEDLRSDDRLEKEAVVARVVGKLMMELMRGENMAAWSRIVRSCFHEGYPEHSPPTFSPHKQPMARDCRRHTRRQPPSFLRGTDRRASARFGNAPDPLAGGRGARAFYRGTARAITRAGGSVACHLVNTCRRLLGNLISILFLLFLFMLRTHTHKRVGRLELTVKDALEGRRPVLGARLFFGISALLPLLEQVPGPVPLLSFPLS